MKSKRVKNQKKKGLDLVRLLCTCGKRVKVSLKFAGKTGTCPKCGATIQIPPLKMIRQKMKELENQRKKKDDNDIDFDIPSLPSLKEIHLEGYEDDMPNTISIVPPGASDNPESTAEELLIDPELLKEAKNIDVEPIAAPAFDTGVDWGQEEPAPEVYKKTEEGQEKTETWEEDDKIQAIDETEDRDFFQTPSEYEEAPADFEDAFKASSFEAEPVEGLEDPMDFLEDPFQANDAIEDFQADHGGQHIENEEVAAAVVEQPLPVEQVIEEVAIEEIEDIEEISGEEISADEEEVAPTEISGEKAIEVENSVTVERGESYRAMEALIIKEEVDDEEEKEFIAAMENLHEEEKIEGGETLVHGWNCLLENKYDESLKCFCECIVRQEDLSATYYARSLLYMKKECWQMALDDITNAKKHGYYQQDADNRFNQILYRQAKYHCEIHAYEQALLDLDRIINRNPQTQKGKVYWQRAQFLIRHGALEEAIADIDEAMFHNYLKPEMFETRGRIYFKQRDYEAAMHDFSAAINRGGNSATLYRARSEAQFYLGNVDEALEDVLVALQLDPDDAALYDLQGLLLAEKQHYSEAQLSFERSFGLEPDNLIHYFNRGLSYIRQGRYDKAVDDFTTVLEYDPQDRMAYLKRAICYQEKNNPNLMQARSDFKVADAMEFDSIYRTMLFELDLRTQTDE